MQHKLHTAFDQTDTLIHLINSFNPYTDVENVQYYLSEGIGLEEALTMPVRDYQVQVTEEMWDFRIKAYSSLLNGVWK